MVTNEVHLSATPGAPPAVIHAVRGDTGRAVRMLMDDAEIFDGSAYILRGRHTETNEAFSFSSAVTVESASAATFTIPGDMTKSAGTIKANVLVKDSGGRTLSTGLFYIVIHPAGTEE